MSNSGSKRINPLILFKMLILQQLFNLSIVNRLLPRLKVPEETQEAFSFGSVIADEDRNNIRVGRQPITVVIPARRP